MKMIAAFFFATDTMIKVLKYDSP